MGDLAQQARVRHSRGPGQCWRHYAFLLAAGPPSTFPTQCYRTLNRTFQLLQGACKELLGKTAEVRFVNGLEGGLMSTLSKTWDWGPINTGTTWASWIQGTYKHKTLEQEGKRRGLFD